MSCEECVICCSNVINTKNNCKICNNSICNSCFIELIDRKDDLVNHKCPFCNHLNFKKLIEIDSPIIVPYFIKNEIEKDKVISKLQSIISISSIDNNEEIKRLKNIIKSKNAKIKENEELIQEKTNIINNILMAYPKPEEVPKKLNYKKFYKITYWGLRKSDIDISPQEAMKRVSILWKEYKKSFEPS